MTDSGVPYIFVPRKGHGLAPGRSITVVLDFFDPARTVITCSASVEEVEGHF